MNDVYITLNNMMIEWGNIVRNQFQMIEKNFNTFFKYVRNELFGFMEFHEKIKNLENDYGKMKANLDKKK